MNPKQNLVYTWIIIFTFIMSSGRISAQLLAYTRAKENVKKNFLIKRITNLLFKTKSGWGGSEKYIKKSFFVAYIQN